MKKAMFEIYDITVTIVVMIFTRWGKGYFDRVRTNIKRFEDFIGRICK